MQLRDTHGHIKAKTARFLSEWFRVSKKWSVWHITISCAHSYLMLFHGLFIPFRVATTNTRRPVSRPFHHLCAREGWVVPRSLWRAVLSSWCRVPVGFFLLHLDRFMTSMRPKQIPLPRIYPGVRPNTLPTKLVLLKGCGKSNKLCGYVSSRSVDLIL